MDTFLFDWDHCLFFKGTIKIEDITQAIWEEFLDLPTLDEVKRFYTLKVETTYHHWGRGLTEDGDFCSHMLYQTNHKGRGSFLVTTIEYIQKQHLRTCQHAKIMYYDNIEHCSKETLETPKIGLNWLDCRLPNKGDYYFLDHNVCKSCKDYQKKENK
jgi:hypothetical protein